MTAFWLWNAWRGFRGYIIPGTLQLFVLRFRMMLRVRDSCFLRSCFTLPRRHVSESLSSLDYTAFNETRVRFLFTRASAIQKIHSSLLYNHFNRKKNDHFNRYRTFFLFFFFFFWHLRWKLSKDTTHGGTQWSDCCVNSFFPSKQSLTAADRARPLSCEEASRSRRGGGGGSQGEEEEAVLGISAQRPEWTPDRLFWPSPGYQNKRTLRHINHHVG